MSNEGYIVKPVHKAFEVLQCVAHAHEGLSLGEICRRLELPKTTAYRYLYTMEHQGFVMHDPLNHVYRVGVRVWEIGHAAGRDSALCQAALPRMRHLRRTFDETINLAVLDGAEVLYLAMVESRRTLLMQAKAGGRDPAYSTALGKAILAFILDEQVRQILPFCLVPRTSSTHTSLNSLRRELELTRRRGYARDESENEEGALCIAAPIFGSDDQPIAAVSLAAPASRLGGALEKKVACAILDAAQAISATLGYRPE